MVGTDISEKYFVLNVIKRVIAPRDHCYHCIAQVALRNSVKV